MIEKKILIFGLFVLLLLPASALAADVDSSPESTIVFDETLPDDVIFYPDNETHGTGYAEGFNDVSDWSYQTSGGLAAGQYGVGTDGDVGEFWAVFNDSGNEYVVFEYVLDTAISIDSYLEFRHKGESLDVIDYIQLVDSSAAVYFALAGGRTTVWHTYRIYLGGSGLDDIKKVRLRVDDYPNSIASGNLSFFFDYGRIGPADEMGWQHDGSTTAGVTAIGAATVSSDGDLLSINRGAGGSAAYILVDSTTTASKIDPDYYPFLEVCFDSSSIGNWTAIWAYDGASSTLLLGDQAITKTIYRFNLKAAVGSDEFEKVLIYALTASGTVKVNYVKPYSIANFTVTLNSATTNDYLYVDAGVLYSTVDSGYIELDHDPTLSVVPDTYPLYYNLSTIGTAPEFSMYVSSWSTYSDETRGIISSRIVTDIKLKFDSTEIISEIKFAMDAISIFDELFLSLDMWGYFGPLGLVVIGYLLTKKDKPLGIFMFIVDCLAISHYLTLVDAMPDYWWHIFILLLGVILCIVQMTKR